MTSKTLTTLILGFTIALNGFSSALAGENSKKVALVYNGPGACSDLCAEAAANVARRDGLSVRWVSAETLSAETAPEVFKNVVVWIQPGGNAIIAAKHLGVHRMDLIRNWVNEGGNYVGFCAGAFLADKTVDNDETIPGLGLIPFSTFDYPIETGEWGTLLDFNWNGQKRKVYFNGGGSFKVPKKDIQSGKVEVFARFAKEGHPASIQTTYGLGRVVLTGPHPEALQWWKDEANREDREATDEDGDDFDLAGDMLNRALGRN
jgi:glutamine amidotransferase-like uncharacterized protein